MTKTLHPTSNRNLTYAIFAVGLIEKAAKTIRCKKQQGWRGRSPLKRQPLFHFLLGMIMAFNNASFARSYPFFMYQKMAGDIYGY